MLIITVYVDAPGGKAIGIKEDLAMYLEQFGDTKIVSIKEENPEQLKIYNTTPGGGKR